MSEFEMFAGAARISHPTMRLDFVAPEPFPSFRDRYEAAVPEVDLAAFASDADWAAVRRRTAALAPHAFLRYARLDGGAFFARAGHTTACTTYLMGNHVFAEMMFRHDPGILLYAPLRVVIFEDKHGSTHLAVDQPSTRFATFDNPDIAAVGRMLDERLADLVAVLGLVAAPAVAG
ncbi:MAG TPA: DUF302 domain-containing protein [Sporichthyaceae bacterium]|jgi:hypothetical protein|nr:DUF302 domain-containing protein [Sporichthyaceae bacterium]